MRRVGRARSTTIYVESSVAASCFNPSSFVSSLVVVVVSSALALVLGSVRETFLLFVVLASPRLAVVTRTPG